MFDPATGRVTKRVAFASPADVDAAVSAAGAAFGAWRSASLTERTKVLFRFRELLHLRAEDLAAIITSEHGKVLSDALGEVTRGLEVVEFACGMPQLLKGSYSEGVSSRVDVYSIRQPLGVVADDQPVQLSGDGPVLVLPDRDRGRQRGDREAEREGSVGGQLDGRAAGPRPASRPACSTSCTATRSRSTRCSSTRA